MRIDLLFQRVNFILQFFPMLVHLASHPLDSLIQLMHEFDIDIADFIRSFVELLLNRHFHRTLPRG